MIKKLLLILLIISTFSIVLILINFKGLRTFVYEDFYYQTTLPKIELEVKAPVKNNLLIKDKNWLHKTNSYVRFALNKNKYSGFELDLVWVDSLNDFIVNHPPDVWTGLTFKRFIKQANQQNLWLDIKNLDKWNNRDVLTYLNELEQLYHFKNKIIVESTNAKGLEELTNYGYFTSYYIDDFNCYSAVKDTIVTKAAMIAYNLSTTNVCALSSDFCNVIFLEKYFGEYPILTWYLPEKFDWSERLRSFNLQQKEQIKIILSNK